MARRIPLPASLRRLGGDSEGATLVEFAFVGPVLILMIMGLFDIAHTQYTSSVLHGAMQKAARDLTLENAGSRQGSIDERVIAQVRSVMPNGAEVTLQKFSHNDFSDVNEPEEFTDQNGDGTCNNNEPYAESNGIPGWQARRGSNGIGGARDVVLYQATVTYPRMFPMYGLAGLPTNIRLQAATVLRSQPFDEQNRRTNTPGNCT
jgi:hypothetical protein